MSIGHRVYDCLLDTGSEVCLFPEDVVDSAVVKKTVMLVLGLGLGP